MSQYKADPVLHQEADSLDSGHDLEKHRQSGKDLGNAENRNDTVTLKTWLVVWAMSFSYGGSFWPVPYFSTIQGDIAVELGSTAANGTWYDQRPARQKHMLMARQDNIGIYHRRHRRLHDLRRQ